MFPDGSILSVRMVNNKIKELCRSVGVDPHRRSSHSLRSGGATYLFQLGVPIALIQLLGRWSENSETLQRRYLKPSPVRVRSMISSYL